MNVGMKDFREVLAEIARIAGQAAGQNYSEVQDGVATRGTALKRPSQKRPKQDLRRTSGVELRSKEEANRLTASRDHVHGAGIICGTEGRGFATANNLSPIRIRVDATEGFIPLWEKNTTLRWRFREQSMQIFQDPEAAKEAITELFGEAIADWGDAAPVRFSHNSDTWDFEFVMRNADDCDENGCVLAAAFFPDGGRHQVFLYPKMFEQTRREQVETLIHEFGHVFGLRHFFANVSEKAWPSELFGEDNPFSIMNYGAQSVLTEDDKADLKRLYESAWSGELTAINGTPIRLVRPYHAIGQSIGNSAAAANYRPC